MYPETKEAVRRVMRICQMLYGMNQDDYDCLLEATNDIVFPSREEIEILLHDRFKDEVIDPVDFVQLIDEGLVEELKNRYSNAAEDAGFDAEYGLAMLEYAAIIRDLEEDGYG